MTPLRSPRLRPQVALSKAETDFDLVTDPLSFYQNVSPSKDLRDASNEAEVLVRDYSVDSSMRLDVFKAKQAAEENIKKSGKKLSDEEARLVEKMILDGTRAGLALPEEKRKELAALQKEVSQVSLEFSVRSLDVLLAVFIAEVYNVEKFQRGEGMTNETSRYPFPDSLFIGYHLIHQRRAQRCPRRCHLRLWKARGERTTALRCYLQDTRYLPRCKQTHI